MHKKGDSVRIIDPSHPKADTIHEVLEASEDGTVRTSLGWFTESQVAAAGGISAEKADELNREIEVDGDKAHLRSVLLRRHASSRTIEQVIDLMAAKQLEVDKAASERGRAGKAVQDREKELKALIRELYALRKADDKNQPLPFETEDEPLDEEGGNDD